MLFKFSFSVIKSWHVQPLKNNVLQEFVIMNNIWEIIALINFIDKDIDIYLKLFLE